MSSALAMVLMAGMAVPGNGPKKVSGEVEQGLDLSGEWKGVCRYRNPGEETKSAEVHLKDGKLHLKLPSGFSATFLYAVIDEGGGKFCLGLDYRSYVGIYKWERDHIVLCIRSPNLGYPVVFEPKGDQNLQNLYILHRVKPGK
jgi:hypothetical protein